MIELRLILLAYFKNLREWLRTHLFGKKLYQYSSSIKYFKKGDLIETEDGTTGRIWRVYVKIKTGQPIGCGVIWDITYKGDKITPYVPVEDKSPRFNPVIRQQQ